LGGGQKGKWACKREVVGGQSEERRPKSKKLPTWGVLESYRGRGKFSRECKRTRGLVGALFYGREESLSQPYAMEKGVRAPAGYHWRAMEKKKQKEFQNFVIEHMTTITAKLLYSLQAEEETPVPLASVR